MPTTTTRANAKRRQPQAGAPVRRAKGMLSDARRAGKAGKKADAVEVLSDLVASPAPHPTRTSSPSPTVRVIGFDAPDCSPIVPITPVEVLRRKQSAEFWAVIEGRSPRQPVLRKAASFAGYPIAPATVTGLGITLASSSSSSADANLASQVASTSRLLAPAPTLRKAASFPGYLPSAPKPSSAAATASPLAVSLLRTASGCSTSLKAIVSPAISTSETVASSTTSTSASTSSCTAVAALRRVASSASIGARTGPAASRPASSPATTVASPPVRVASCLSPLASFGAGVRRPSSSSQRSASSIPAARILRRMISYDSVASTSSQDDFQFDLASALDTSDYESDAETLVDSDSDIDDDDDADGSEWETASTCAGSPPLSVCSF